MMRKVSVIKVTIEVSKLMMIMMMMKVDIETDTEDSKKKKILMTTEREGVTVLLTVERPERKSYSNDSGRLLSGIGMGMLCESNQIRHEKLDSPRVFLGFWKMRGKIH